MKERFLFGLPLLCILISAVFLGFILNSRSALEAQSLEAGPAGFHNIIQLQNGINNFKSTLETYRNHAVSSEQFVALGQKLRKQYNILWSSLSNVYVKFPPGSDFDKQLIAYKQSAANFLAQSEPLLLPKVEPNHNQLHALIHQTQVLSDLTHQLGASYYNYNVVYRDNLANNIKRLHKLLLAFTGTLLLSTAILVIALIRSNFRKNALVRETENARSDLKDTIAELRSGRLEQRAKNSFIAAASHDLKQPLHALGLFLGSLDSEIHSKKGRKTLEDATNCATSLGSLFNSLLDISRLDAGVVEVHDEHFYLEPVIQMLAQEMRAKANKLNIRIEVNIDNVVICSDPILFCRVIRNLVENALVHSNASVIAIRCSELDHQLVVEDNGRGIPVEEHSRIFREYNQLENQNATNSKGLGLGLAIVKRMSDLLNISINLHSVMGQLTRFTLQLIPGEVNKVRENESPYQISSHTDIAHQGVNVCVIDDEESICIAMRTMLLQMGMNPVVGADANMVIDACIEEQVQPDLIIADYRLLNGRTGDEAILQVKRALNIDVPAMIITGDTSPAQVAHAAKSGFTLLHKPVQPQFLATSIAEILDKSITHETSQAS